MGRKEVVRFECDRCGFSDTEEEHKQGEFKPKGWIEAKIVSDTVRPKELWCEECSSQFLRWYRNRSGATELHS